MSDPGANGTPKVVKRLEKNKKTALTKREVYQAIEYVLHLITRTDAEREKMVAFGEKKARKKAKFILPVLSLIRVKAKDTVLFPGYTGPFSGGKSPDNLVAEMKGAVDKLPAYIRREKDMERKEIMKMLLNRKTKTGHFNTHFGDTRAVMHHLGKSTLTEIVRGALRDVWRRVMNAMMLGILAIQNVSAERKVETLCYSVGITEPEKDIVWEKLLVQIIASSLFAYCVAMGKDIDAIGWSDDFPQLKSSVIERAEKNYRNQQKMEKHAHYSSPSESEEEEEEQEEAAVENDDTVGDSITPEQIAKKKATAQKHWNTVRLMPKKKKAGKTLSIADAALAMMSKKKRTMARWSKLKANVGGQVSVTQAFKSNVMCQREFLARIRKSKAAALKKSKKWTEVEEHKCAQNYVRLRGTQRYLPIEECLDGQAHLEPIMRALALVTMWLYESKACGPTPDESGHRLNLTTVMKMMSQKTVPSECLLRMSHSLAIHLKYLYYDSSAAVNIQRAAFLPKVSEGSLDVWTAIKEDNLSACARVFRSGVDLSTTLGDAGITPLHQAAKDGKLEIVFWLISNDAEIGKRSKVGMNALHYACKHNRPKMVALLLDFDMDVLQDDKMEKGSSYLVDSRDSLTGFTALHYASAYDSTECIKELLLRCAKTNLKDSEFRTCIDVARVQNNEESLSLLLNDQEKTMRVKLKEARSMHIPLRVYEDRGWDMAKRYGNTLGKEYTDEKKRRRAEKRAARTYSRRPKALGDVEHFFVLVEQFTIKHYAHQYKYDTEAKNAKKDSPMFSVTTFKALAYIACYMALLKGKIRREAVFMNQHAAKK